MPSDEERMAAIRAAPEDDPPRLAFAAQIEARDPDRAAMIRRQCAAATAPPATPAFAAPPDADAPRWLASLGLQGDEGALRRGFLDAADLSALRAVALLPRLAEEPLRDLTIRVDLSGNEDELAALVPTLAAIATLRALRIDRRAHWDHRARSDALAVDGAALHLTVGEAAPPRPLVALLRRLVARRRDLEAVTIDFAARGRVDADEVLDALITGGPLTKLATLELGFVDGSGRDWMRWLECRRLADLLAACPALTRLSLPMASLTLERLDHRALRDLELGWLGVTPMGPADPDGDGRGPRASGLAFLRGASLPALERLAIDFQFRWYTPWTADDHLTPLEADLPRLRALVLRYAEAGDLLCERLAAAPFAATLERLDLVGSAISDRGVEALIAGRERLPQLRSLVLIQPLDVSDAAWARLRAAFPIDEAGL